MSKNRMQVYVQKKNLLPNIQEILLLASNKAVKGEAKLVTSDELKDCQKVQDSNSFHMLPAWERRQTACPVLWGEGGE